MFSHCMKRRGQQHYWLPPLAHVTRVMWPRRTWPVGLAADRHRCGHLNRACPRGFRPLIWGQRERGGDRQQHQTPRASHTQGDTQTAGPEMQYAGRTEVTHTDGHTRPRACSSACTLCTAARLTKKICPALIRTFRSSESCCTVVWLCNSFSTLLPLSIRCSHSRSLPVAERTGANWVIIKGTRSTAADWFERARL